MVLSFEKIAFSIESLENNASFVEFYTIYLNMRI